MSPDHAFLTLLQFADGLFPAGGFAHSLGLETYVQDAERDGDSELAEFFRRAQEASRRGGERGKELLGQRVAKS